MTTEIPRLLITPGEPAGIGPELCVQIAQQQWSAELIFIADPVLLQQYADLLSLDINIEIWTPTHQRKLHKPNQLTVLPIELLDNVEPGVLSNNNSGYVLETLSQATDLMLIPQMADALVTGPVHKGVLNNDSSQFSGHTEFFAERASAKQVVMMLACDSFRVALVTTHLPLKDVAAAITKERITKIIKTLNSEMIDKFNIKSPTIHVCGLNPHAGESGHLGREEIEIIEPVLKQLRTEGIKLVGPLPADTALTPTGLKGADVTLAMYHDQGLPALKYAGFGNAVNITLGLPFIRLSVDHGTALDLAGKGQASSGSLQSAIEQSLLMLERNSVKTQISG